MNDDSRLSKWIHGAIPALLIHVSIGCIYCFSTYKQTISSALGYSDFQIGWLFSIAIFFLGTSAAFAGPLVERNVHRSSFFSMCCFVLGTVATGLILKFGESLSSIGRFLPLVLLYIAYVVVGIGLGTGYISPVKTLMLWFAKTPGLGVGLSIAGFGLAKTIFTPVMEYLQHRYSISSTFFILGGIYFAMMFIGFLLLRKPRTWKEPDAKVAVFSTFKYFKDRRFTAMWILFFVNIAMGLTLIPYEKQLVTHAFGYLDDKAILLLVSFIPSLSALFNAGGRVGYATLTDRMKDKVNIYKVIYATSILVSVAGCFISRSLAGGVLAIVLLVVVNWDYGAGFSTIPTILKQFYGMQNISKIHGMILTAWSMAGLVGNNLSQLILNMGYGYNGIILATVVLYTVSALIGFHLVRTPSPTHE